MIPVAGWSSPVARRAHNPKARGSNPLPATKIDQGFAEMHSLFLLAQQEGMFNPASAARKLMAKNKI
jgi:hypothetical protein